MTSLPHLALAALSLLVSLPAIAEKDAPAPEQEFVDMPDDGPDHAPAKAPQPPPAADEKKHAGYIPGYRAAPSVGLSPHAPELQPSLPGALTPAFGAPTPTTAFRLQFHGYLQAAARASVGARDNASAGQSGTTLHADPVVPGAAYGWFDHSGTIPDPWTELNFVYGNKLVAATMSVAAWSLSQVDSASGSAMPQAQLWIANAFLTYSPDVTPVRLKMNVGVFPDRYGFMGKQQQGAYGELLIAGLGGMGATTTVELPFEGDVTLTTEAGFKGQFGKAPLGMPFDASTDFARAEQGSTFAAHGHLGVTYLDRFTLAGHYLFSWSQDDRKDAADALADGRLSIAGLDLRMDARRFGYLYVGGARVSGENVDSVSNLVRILNTGGGYELDQRYWGFDSHGNGALMLVGGQYTLSLGTLLRYPMEFSGEGPDLSVSLFGIYGRSTSSQPEFDNHHMAKYGAEAVYSFAEYVAGSLRIDHVLPDLADPSRAFAVISPRLVLRTGWLTRESLTFQYSYYALGENAVVEGDRRLVNITSQRPDRHVLAVYATTWW